MKVLLSTYSAETHSSYGKVTRDLWRRLLALHPDWDVVQHGWMHRSDEPVEWPIESTKTVQTNQGPMPMPEDKYGQLSFESIVSRLKPDVVWTVSDAFMCEHMGQYRPRHKFKLVKHIPIDGAPVPPHWGDALRDCDVLVPVTDFGTRALEPLVGRRWDFIYHGVDTEKFYPVPDEQIERPQAGNMTDKTFVLGFVGHSQWRKQNWNLFAVTRYLRDGAWIHCKDCERVTLDPYDEIWSKFGPKVTNCWYCGSSNVERPGPQDIALWYHTFDRANVDINPTKLKMQWNLEGSVIFTGDMKADHGIPDAEMPQLFRMFDAYLSLSGAEGFCIPIIEAAASGVPVVYSEYSGQAEVGAACGGLPVRPAILQPNFQEPVYRAIADIGEAVRQVWRLMTNKALYDSCVARGLQAAKTTFSWDRVAVQWSQVIESLPIRKLKSYGVTL